MAKFHAPDINIPGLVYSMRRSRLVLQRYRENRRELVRQFIGKNYSEHGTDNDVVINLFALFVSVVGRGLIPQHPRVMYSTFDYGLKPAVSAMQSWANRHIKKTKFKNSVERVITDALFSIGIAKVALVTPAESASRAFTIGAGQPLTMPIDLDDWVFDTHCHDFSEYGYMGHRFRVPLAVVKDDPHYNRTRKQLQASTDKLYNEQGDERIGVLGRGTYGWDDEYEDMVDLWEVYLPRHRTVITLADDYLTGATGLPMDGNEEGLGSKRWIGPDCGPYHVLAYSVVPGNPMPKAPLQDLRGLHEAANRSMRKMIQTIDRIKEVGLVNGGATEDGRRIMDLNDGEIGRVDDTNSVKQMVFGGQAVQTLWAMTMGIDEKFSKMSGNLDILGGLAPEAKTLGQDKMLNENSSRQMAAMQNDTIDYSAQLLEALSWYWWHDPYQVQRTLYTLPGLPGMTMKREVYPQDAKDQMGRPQMLRRQGRYEDLNIEIDPYTYQYQTPQTQLQGIMNFMQTVVMPMMPMLQQQGKVIDMDAFMHLVSECMNNPRMNEIFTIQEQPQDGSDGTQAPDRTPMPAKTERSYTRHNVSEQTPQSSARNDIQAMLGNNVGGSPNGQRQMVGA